MNRKTSKTIPENATNSINAKSGRYVVTIFSMIPNMYRIIRLARILKETIKKGTDKENKTKWELIEYQRVLLMYFELKNAWYIIWCNIPLIWDEVSFNTIDWEEIDLKELEKRYNSNCQILKFWKTLKVDFEKKYNLLSTINKEWLTPKKLKNNEYEIDFTWSDNNKLIFTSNKIILRDGNIWKLFAFDSNDIDKVIETIFYIEKLYKLRRLGFDTIDIEKYLGIYKKEKKNG